MYTGCKDFFPFVWISQREGRVARRCKYMYTGCKDFFHLYGFLRGRGGIHGDVTTCIRVVRIFSICMDFSEGGEGCTEM